MIGHAQRRPPLFLDRMHEHEVGETDSYHLLIQNIVSINNNDRSRKREPRERRSFSGEYLYI